MKINSNNGANAAVKPGTPLFGITNNNRSGTMTLVVMRCLYSRPAGKQSLRSRWKGIHEKAKGVSVPQRRQAYRLSSAAVSGQQTPRALDTSAPTLMNWWTIMCRQWFFMSRAWVLSAASRIWSIEERVC